MARSTLPLFCLSPVLLSLFGLATPTHAATPTNISTQTAKINLATRAGVHAEFERLVFDWPFAVDYRLERANETLTLHFTAPANVNLNSLAAARLSRIAGLAVVSTDPLVLSGRVAKDATITEFRNGKAIVLDIKGAKAPMGESVPPSPAPSVAVPSTTPAPAKIEPTTPLLPTANAQSTPQPAPQSLPASAETPPVTSAPAAETTKPEVEAGEESSAVKSEIKLDKQTAEFKTITPPLQADAITLDDTPQLVAAFDPKIATGAVIFERAGYVYFLFDRILGLDEATLTGGKKPKVTLQSLNLAKASGFRFRLPEGADIRTGLSGTNWQIFLSKKKQEVPITTQILAQPEFALGARLFYPTVNAGDPILFTDPVAGDTLVLVPLRNPTGFGATRRLRDLMILPSSQGLVVKPFSDKLILRTTTDGIEITAEGGLALSSSKDTGSNAGNQPRQKRIGKPMFDLLAWRGKPEDNFTERRQKLMQAVVDVPIAERNRARLELARHYFSHGMGPETLSMLEVLQSDVPDLAGNPEFLALRGAASIQANRPADGLKDIAASKLENQPEIELWEAVGLAQLRNWKEALEQFENQRDLLSQYPEPFASKFYVLAIEAAIALDKERVAAEWLDQIEGQPHAATIKPALSYLRGVLHSKMGRPELAADLWRQVTKSRDRLYKTRAELALTDLAVATKSLTPKQAAEKLEGLRFAWRGDELEVDILQRLGEFYLDFKDYRSGLGILSQVLKLYPNSAQAADVRKLMAGTFHLIFVDNQTEGLSPLSALALYQDYHDLMPKGEQAQAVIFNLAENLVAIDLLDQATALLEDQIKLTNDASGKLKLSTRLAAIYLLDRKSDAALAALGHASAEGASTEIRTERELLRGRALSENGKYDEALATLNGLEGQNVILLRADIMSRAKRWPESAKLLRDLVGAPPKEGELLSPQQASWLVSCALAYAMAGDTASLDQLAIDYGTAMTGTNQNTVFRILTRPDKTLQPKDIIAAQSKITEVDLFRSFLDGYRKN